VEGTNSPEGSRSTTLCNKKYLKFRSGETKTIICNANTFGQYVKLSLPGKKRILTLCEVEVYGFKGKRIASLKCTTGKHSRLLSLINDKYRQL